MDDFACDATQHRKRAQGGTRAAGPSGNNRKLSARRLRRDDRRGVQGAVARRNLRELRAMFKPAFWRRRAP
jgi:hypothetical protein